MNGASYVQHDGFLLDLLHTAVYTGAEIQSQQSTTRRTWPWHKMSLYVVGTVGTGVWLSFDGGESWGQGRDGIFGDARVFSLTVHPHEPHTVLAGTDDGLFCSRDNGKRFERVDAPMNGKQVWRIAVDPVDPQTIFVGTCPSALYRSKDGGQHWEQLQVELAETCPAVRIPRVTSLVVDPSITVWCGLASK